MNVLLLSMPDSFEHMPEIVIRMPNGALTSLAGNIDPHHRVAVADLILVQRSVRSTVERLMREFQPDVVGLSVMTFQRRTAIRIVELVRSMHPGVRIVVGGYDPSLAPEAYTGDTGIDFIVRGEGEITFRDLIRTIESGDDDYQRIPGLSFRSGGQFHHNAERTVSSLIGEDIRPPKRESRVLQGYTMMGRQVDVVETSRGCTFDCSFCSIIEMRGRNFHTYDLDRVIADIRDAYDKGARAIFLVDDNITLNIHRFESLCRKIVEVGLNRIDYIVQAMTSSIANHGDSLAPLMQQAGFRYVFLGIENILDTDLGFLRAQSKNEERNNGHVVGNATLKAIEHIHRNGMFVVGGLIVGNPGDTPESIEANLEFARRYVDWPYIQHPTPYPRTPMTQDLRDRNLIADDEVENYDGTTAVVRTEGIEPLQVEFMRWQAERWMKLRHMSVVFGRDPLFILKNGFRMFWHTFRGCGLKTLTGFEDEHRAFERYRELRTRERIYI
ncbi:MAG TPA: radical SAM protein [Terriglobia bacterium]|nr:radical SAM protein [Terriglobia bacterium]